MLKHLKSLTRHSAIYGAGHILTRALAFLLLPLYTNILAPDAFGLASLLLAFLAIANIIYVYGMDSAFLRFYISAQSEREKQVIFSTTLIALALSSVFLSSSCFAFSETLAQWLLHDAAATPLIRLCAGILLLESLGALPFLAMRAEEKSLQYISYKLLNTLLILALNWLFLVRLNAGTAGIFQAQLWTAGAMLVLMVRPTLRRARAVFSAVHLRQALRFGLPYIPTTMAVLLMDVIDRFLLERLIDTETVGIYSAGYRLGMFMALFIAAFRFAWPPFFLKMAKEPNAPHVFSTILTAFLSACALVYLAVAFFVDDLIKLRIGDHHIFGPDYWHGSSIVPIIMLAYIFYGLYVNFVVGIHLKKKTKYLPAITGAGALTNIVANLLLIPSLGMVGAAWATVLGYLVMAGLLYAVAHRLYPVPYDFAAILKLAGIALMFYLGAFYTKPGFFIKLVLLLAFPVVLSLVNVFDRVFQVPLTLKFKRIFNAIKLK